MMPAPRFWTHVGWQSRLLQPISLIYGRISGARMRQPPRHRAPVPVIAIGNFTAGGAGKTPTAIAITHLAIGLGFSPIVLMRGYGGRARGPILVDAEHDRAIDVGDEALMIAQAGVPVIASRDRVAGADHAIACGCDLIILDDGFQSPTLAKNLSLVVIDGLYGIGNGAVMPSGPLRAPLDVQMAQMDALIVVSNGQAGSAASNVIHAARKLGKAVFTADIRPDKAAGDMGGLDVVAFAGIGRPEKLAEGLRARGAHVAEMIGFADHHRYTPREAQRLIERAGDRLLVTTAKDMARLSGEPDPYIRALARRCTVASVELVFDEPSAVSDLLERTLRPIPAEAAGVALVQGAARG